jgi:flavodoxin
VKALVIYDSEYGHTEQIAQAIGASIDSQVLRAGGVDPADPPSQRKGAGPAESWRQTGHH